MEDAAGESETAEALVRYVDVADAAERLTAEDEIRLARLIGKGWRAADAIEQPPIPFDFRIARLKRSVRQAKAARKQLVDCNRRLVIPIAKRYTGRGMGLWDLIEEGHHGLKRAVDKFDARTPYEFSKHANPFIRDAIVRALRDQGPGEDGPAGVREPRKPYPPIDSAVVAADPDNEATGPTRP
jgi:RNA polymerase primary sigma factor